MLFYVEGPILQGNFHGLDYNSLDVENEDEEEAMNQEIGATSNDQNSNQIVDYMLPNHHHHHQPPLLPSNLCSSNSLDKLSFADVMQFADFGPKLGLNQTKTAEEEAGLDPVYFLKFPVLNDHHENEEHQLDDGGKGEGESVQLRFVEKAEGKSKRKRPRTVKTVEEVESQRMTHIAVERNRRKQMNEHLRVLRSLMPSSYVQRGDQASIIGGAIEFVRELEQLLQCLESQKRRRLYGDGAMGVQQQQPQMYENEVGEYEGGGVQEEMAESKSCLADVEVKLLGFDGLIKILSRRRHGQLIKTIASLEDLNLTILHTNITTIEQTVLYSFNVKISGEARFTAEDLANSVQQIFTFIHANTAI